jgi:uncharacterized protein
MEAYSMFVSRDIMSDRTKRRKGAFLSMTENWRDDEEYVSYIEDLLATDEVQRLADYTQHMNSTRLEHSISVSYNSYKLAKQFNGDARATARAGLLHDLFYYDWRTTKFDEGSHAYMHPRIAVKNAEKITELSDLERDIIIKHMWGATITPPKYKESYIVTMVDKYCAIREAAVPLVDRFNSYKARLRKEWN